MSREAMQLALEALESDPISHTGLVNRKQAITALRQALVDADDISEKRVEEKAKREHEWVGLTHPQIHELDWPDGVSFEDILLFVRAIEQALKEKNT